MFKIAVDVRWQEQDEGIYLIYYNQDVFEANEMVISMLELCRQPQSEENLISVLLKKYEVERIVLQKDIADTISQFKEAHIIEEVKNEQ